MWQERHRDLTFKKCCDSETFFSFLWLKVSYKRTNQVLYNVGPSCNINSLDATFEKAGVFVSLDISSDVIGLQKCVTIINPLNCSKPFRTNL